MKKTIFFALCAVVLMLSSCGTLTYTGDFCRDGLMDRDETDVDCGGQYCEPCGLGEQCDTNADCASGICENHVCVGDTTDTDGDGIVDIFDRDDDEDGFADRLELKASSDPLDAASIPSGCRILDDCAEYGTTYFCDSTHYCVECSDARNECESYYGIGYTCDAGVCIPPPVECTATSDCESADYVCYDGYCLLTDTDRDGVGDSVDACAGAVDSVDTDADGIPDGCDVTDSDGDGLSDYDEITAVYGYATSQTNADTDGDSLSDYDEIMTYNTNPLTADTDNDGVSDSAEITASTDPLVADMPQQQGCAADTHNDGCNDDDDSDSVTDEFDVCAGYDDTIDADRDMIPDGCDNDDDNDGVDNSADLCPGYDDTVDTDSDGYANDCDNDDDGDVFADVIEVQAGTDPLNAASEPAHCNNIEYCADMYREYAYFCHIDQCVECTPEGTECVQGYACDVGVCVADTDGDNYPNTIEVYEGTDPYNADSYPVES